MRLRPIIPALLVFLLVANFCSLSFGQEGTATPSHAPQPVPLTTLPQSVLEAELKSARGQPFRLSDYSGKVLVINFWEPWAGPCRQEIPELVNLQERLWSQGVRVVGLSTESPADSVAEVRRFVRNFRIQYKIGWATPEVARIFMQGRDVIPQTYIVSRTGRIVGRFVGFNPAKTPAQVKAAVAEALHDRLQSPETEPR